MTRHFYCILGLVILSGAPVFAQSGTIGVEALIDGRSQLILQADTAQWYHLDFAAPGRHEFQDEPTYLNGVPWLPMWPDVPDAENRECECYSDTYVGVVPPLPMADYGVQLEVVQARGDVQIVEPPSAANNYRVVIEFNDNPILGSEWYEVNLHFQTCDLMLSLPVPGSAGMINEFAATGGTPGARIAFLGACRPGLTVGGAHGCDFALGLARPTLVGVAAADGGGAASTSAFVEPRYSVRTVYLQALDLSACCASEVLAYGFP